jgi:hypothetical protein
MIFPLNVSHFTSHYIMFRPIWSSSDVKIVVLMATDVLQLSEIQSFCMWSHLCASVSRSDGSYFLLCVSVCGPIYALVYPVVMGHTFCCVCICMWSHLCASVSRSDGSYFLLCVSVCGPIYALAYPEVMGRTSCCVVPSMR